MPEVRLIDENGEQVGVIPTPEALEKAREQDLDLVEVAPNSKPPVTRILDYSKYKYEQEQKAKAARKHQQQTNIREIKLRPKIAQHDYETKRGHVERFLRQTGQGEGDDHVPRPRAEPPRARPDAARPPVPGRLRAGDGRAGAPPGGPQHAHAAGPDPQCGRQASEAQASYGPRGALPRRLLQWALACRR